MNTIGIALLWCVAQVTLIGLLAAGGYLAVRRLRPAAAAPVVLSGLAMVVVLSLAALSPWPRWTIHGPAQPPAEPAMAETPPLDSPARPLLSRFPRPPAGERPESLPVGKASGDDDAVAIKEQPSGVAALWQTFLDKLAKLEAADSNGASRLPGVMAALLLAAMACGLGWLMLGLAAVRWQRHRSRPVRDGSVLELVDALRAELGCQRPVLLLPADWTAWTAEQRRAVLAHEIVHARSHDFIALLVGQLGLALHFYHPLLHWLIARLRLEQELAADAAAAGVSGGQRQYLTAIAELALGQQDRPLLWPARSFLPTRTTFLRRIAMLRDSKLRFERLSPLARVLTVGAVLLCGLLVAGLRGPAAQAGSPAASKIEEKPGPIADQPAEGTKQGEAAKPIADPGTVELYGTVELNAATGTSDSAPGDSDFFDYRMNVPGYELLVERALVKELNLTADQVKKLREIIAKYGEDMQAFYKDAKDLPQDERSKAFSRWERDERKAIRQQVAAVLTPQQTQALKELVFAGAAFARLQDPKTQENLHLTKEQKDKLLVLQKEIGSFYASTAPTDKALAILSPQQRLQLREAALGPLGPESNAYTAADVEGETKPVFVPALYPYPDFSDDAVQKQLALNATQRNQVRAILGDSANPTEKFVRALGKKPLSKDEKANRAGVCLLGSGTLTLTGANTYMGNTTVGGGALLSSDDKSSPEEKAKLKTEAEKQAAEFEKRLENERAEQQAELAKQPLMKLKADLLKQFEALLTPEQLVAYKDLAIHSMAEIALQDPIVLHRIAASDQQAAALRRLFDESMAAWRRLPREMGKKMLEVLTPAQREALRAETEAEAARIEKMIGEPPSGKPGKAAEGNSGTLSLYADTLTFDADAPAAAPVPAAKAAPARGETGAVPAASAPVGASLSVTQLQAYWALSDPKLRKQFGIDLSPQQTKRLHEIADDWAGKSQELLKEPPPKTADQQELAKFQGKWDQALGDCRKQVEAVLTPQQLQAYKKGMLPWLAFDMLRDPQIRKTIGVTREQQDALQQLKKEFFQQVRQEFEPVRSAALAVLSPQQREKLRPEVEQTIRAWEELAVSQRIGTAESGPLTLTVTGQAAVDEGLCWIPMGLPVYVELGETAAAQQLGLSTDQRKQLAEVAAEYQKETEKLRGEMLKLSPDQRKRPEFQEKGPRMLQDTRRRIEALLTPQQLTALKEMIFRGTAFGMLAGPGVQEKIGLGDQQKANIQRIYQDEADKRVRLYREVQEKSFALLTPPQQKKLRAEMDRRGW
jgi:autotransporter-associated beta strand protein